MAASDVSTSRTGTYFKLQPGRSFPDPSAVNRKIMRSRQDYQLIPEGVSQTIPRQRENLEDWDLGNRLQDWDFENRRQAQQVLDFMHLGPHSVVRDQEWLRSQNFTMILVIGDTKLWNRRLVSVDKASKELGIRACYVGFRPNDEIFSQFTEVIGMINDHMIHQAYFMDADADADMAKRPGKVLVVCETGNHRSAFIVAAYIMAMYGVDYTQAIGHLIRCRKSCYIYGHLQPALHAWHHDLHAHRQTFLTYLDAEAATPDKSSPDLGTMKSQRSDADMSGSSDTVEADQGWLLPQSLKIELGI